MKPTLPVASSQEAEHGTAPLTVGCQQTWGCCRWSAHRMPAYSLCISRPPCCSKHCYIATQWLNGHCSISLTCYNKENESCISSKQQAKLTQIQRQANRRTTKTSEQPHVLKWIRWIDRSPDRTRYINQSPEIPPHKPFKSGTSSNLGQQQSPDRTRHTNQSP